MASSKVMPSTSSPSTNPDLTNHIHLTNYHHNNNNDHTYYYFNNSNNNSTTTNTDMITEYQNSDPPRHPTSDDVIFPTGNDLGTEITLSDDVSERRRTAEDVWREIVAGGRSSCSGGGGSDTSPFLRGCSGGSKECKVEAPDEMMTLEDFLAKAGAAEEEEEEGKGGGGGGGGGMYGFDHGGGGGGMFAPMPVGMVEYGGGEGRGKRGGGVGMDTVDKAAQQRQRRMIKNRESAARSRERKQNLEPPRHTNGITFTGENNSGTNNCTLLDANITLIDAAGAISAVDCDMPVPIGNERKTVEDVWRDIDAGGKSSSTDTSSLIRNHSSKECKVELDEMMTLEDFLARASAAEDDVAVEEEVKVEASPTTPVTIAGGMYGFDQGMVGGGLYPPMPVGMATGVGPGTSGVVGYGNGGGGVEMLGGRGKRRGGMMLEPVDKAAQQRQKRMIKNRESAARSRERKQAYQVELEALAVKLEEENEQLLREKAERKKERYNQLMEKVVPVVEKRKPPRMLRRVCSMPW